MEEDETKGGGLIKLFMFHQLGLPAAIICCTGELCNTPLFILFSLSIVICMYVCFSLARSLALVSSFLGYGYGVFLKVQREGG